MVYLLIATVAMLALIKILLTPKKPAAIPAKFAPPEPPPKALLPFMKPPKPLRSTKNGDSLTPLEIEIMAKAKCPDCGGQLYGGPEGGCAVMISCGGCPSTFLVLGSVGNPGERTSDATIFGPEFEPKTYRDDGQPV